MSNFLKNRRIFTTKFDLESSGGGISLVTSDDKVKSLIQGTNITIVDNGDGTVTISTNADDIVVVANYSALPSPASVAGNFYWVSASQGTSWLPGSLGGTYYNKGLYYSNGVSWEYIETPYQATQATVNAGTNDDQFITPLTLKNQNYLAPLASPTFTGIVTTPAIIVSSETASRVAIIDASKNVKSADTTTYPSLTEFSYVKGLSSPVQPQLDALTTALPNDLSAWRKTGTGTFKRYYGSSITGLALSTQTIARNNIQYMPLIISRACTMDEVGLEITGKGGAGSVLRIGLYNSSNLLPTSLIFDAGTINANSATKQFITLGTPQVLQPGLYFWAINHNSVANVTVRAIALGACMPLLGQPVTAGTAVGTFYVNTSSTYAAFASTAVTPTTVGTIAMPEIQFYLSA